MKRRKGRGGKAQTEPPEKKRKEAETGEKRLPRTFAPHVHAWVCSVGISLAVSEIGWIAKVQFKWESKFD